MAHNFLNKSIEQVESQFPVSNCFNFHVFQQSYEESILFKQKINQNQLHYEFVTKEKNQQNENPIRSISYFIQQGTSTLMLPQAQLKQTNQEIQSKQLSKQERNGNNQNATIFHKKINRSRLSKSTKRYSKRYRQKNKICHTLLVGENKKLKQKIKDLLFELQQVQIQLNKLKYHPPETTCLNRLKDQCLKEICQVVQDQKASVDQMIDYHKHLDDLNSFQGKQKLSYLNFLMNQILQNSINDPEMYFVDSVCQKKGIWRQTNQFQLRKIDMEVCKILGVKSQQQFKNIQKIFPQFIQHQMRNFKTLWKKLYGSYIQLINQGQRIQSLFKPMANRHMK